MAKASLAASQSAARDTHAESRDGEAERKSARAARTRWAATRRPRRPLKAAAARMPARVAAAS